MDTLFIRLLSLLLDYYYTIYYCATYLLNEKNICNEIRNFIVFFLSITRKFPVRYKKKIKHLLKSK